MKCVAVLIAAIIGAGALACSASNMQYARDLQGCIRDARDAGDSGAERLAKYNACADALDGKDGGR